MFGIIYFDFTGQLFSLHVVVMFGFSLSLFGLRLNQYLGLRLNLVGHFYFQHCICFCFLLLSPHIESVFSLVIKRSLFKGAQLNE